MSSFGLNHQYLLILSLTSMSAALPALFIHILHIKIRLLWCHFSVLFSHYFSCLHTQELVVPVVIWVTFESATVGSSSTKSPPLFPCFLLPSPLFPLLCHRLSPLLSHPLCPLESHPPPLCQSLSNSKSLALFPLTPLTPGKFFGRGVADPSLARMKAGLSASSVTSLKQKEKNRSVLWRNDSQSRKLASTP